MTKMKMYALVWLVACVICPCAILAQTGNRYADPVFEDVTTTSWVPFSSAVGEEELLPTTLYLDFYEPAGDALTARPLVITVFGGAFIAGSRDRCDMEAYCTRLAKHGYAAASIDYRLLSVLSLSASSLIRAAYMASQDVSSAIRFFKAHCQEYRIDTNRIFLLGNSAGSIASLNKVFLSEEERPSQTFTYPDLGPMNSSGYDEYAGFSSKVAGVVAHWGGVLDVGHIDMDEYVPLCMIHGTEDFVVPYDSGYCFSSMFSYLTPYMYGSRCIADHLNSLNITDYEFHPFSGESHNFYISMPDDLLYDKFDSCFNITRRFLYRHLGDQPVTAVSEYAIGKVSVYPNPASDHVFVSHTGAGEVTKITLFDMRGQLVEEHDSSPFSIGHLPSGIYAVHTTDSHGKKSIQKLIVQ